MVNQVVVITQARSNSTRLPAKVLKKVNNQTLLEIHLQRLLQSKLTHHIIVATTDNSADDAIENIAQSMNIECFRGSEQDVLDRYYQAAKKAEPDWVVRVTSDCPLIDPQLLDSIIDFTNHHSEYDYIANTISETFPDGQDIEIFKFSALKKAWENAHLNSEREHVTLYIRNPQNGFKSMNFASESPQYATLRMTVDEQVDYDLIHQLILALGILKTWQEYAEFILQNNLQKINESIMRNEGLSKSLNKEKKHEK
jgi:spore coat polysaccharide biosynthesis protein SpsF